MRWNPKDKSIRAVIAAHWLAGKTGSEIAEIYDVSRNCIIGIVYRMGLTRSPSVSADVRGAGYEKRSKTRAEVAAPTIAFKTSLRTRQQLHGTKRKPMPMIAPAPAVAPSLPRRESTVTLLDLMPGHCRMPLWTYRDQPQTYCADPVIEGTSWCRACTAMVFAPRAVLPPSLRRFVPTMEAAA